MSEIDEFIEFIGKQFISEPIDRHDLKRVEYHRNFMRDITDFHCMFEDYKKNCIHDYEKCAIKDECLTRVRCERGGLK